MGRQFVLFFVSSVTAKVKVIKIQFRKIWKGTNSTCCLTLQDKRNIHKIYDVEKRVMVSRDCIWALYFFKSHMNREFFSVSEHFNLSVWVLTVKHSFPWILPVSLHFAKYTLLVHLLSQIRNDIHKNWGKCCKVAPICYLYEPLNL